MDVIGQDGYSLLESYNASGVMKNCTKCKQPILKGQRRVIIDWHEGNEYQHADCMAAALARAEAAENDLRELRENTLLTLGVNPIDVADGMEDVTISYLLNGWKERITELEARLAAHAWRPVTEPPTEAGYYQTVNDGIYEHCYYGNDGWSDYYLTPTHWRPLTAPPLTGES